jgi:hypothetical protein
MGDGKDTNKLKTRNAGMRIGYRLQSAGFSKAQLKKLLAI